MTGILLTGGWGYGNLGDDAILLETIRLARAEEPGAEISVMTYDPPATRLILEERGLEAAVIPSIHLHLAGRGAFRRFGHVDHQGRQYPCKDIFRKANSRLQPRFYLMSRKALNHPGFLGRLKEDFAQYFRDADVLINSGGGYMNWRFMDSVVAHSCEQFLARDEGTGIMTVGQTIGPMKTGKAYYRPINELARQALSLSDYISVRDQDSSRQLSAWNIDAPIVPDLALAHAVDQPAGTAEGRLTVVLGALPRSAIRGLAEKLSQTVRKTGLTVRIAVSRLWMSDIDSAGYLRQALRELGITGELVVPGEVGELERCLSGSRAVISMNLHGLILAWRSGVPVIAISTNEKTMAFMSQTGSPEAAAGWQDAASGNWLPGMVERVIGDGVESGLRESVAREVEEGFSRGLRAALSVR